MGQAYGTGKGGGCRLFDIGRSGGLGVGKGAGSAFGRSGQGPGGVLVGEAVLDEGAQVDRGASGAQPVWFLTTPRERSLMRRPFWVAVQAMIRSTFERVGVGLRELRAAGGAQQALVWVDGHRAALGGGGAAGAQRAAGAEFAEGCPPGGAHPPGVRDTLTEWLG